MMETCRNLLQKAGCGCREGLEKAGAFARNQQVRISAAVQLILCFLAIGMSVKHDFRAYQKKRRKAMKKK